MDVSFATVIEAVVHTVPDRPAITAPGMPLPYRDFEERAARLARVFQAAEVGEDDKVACHLYSVRAYLETVFAAKKIGAVPVNANDRYTGTELASLLADADAELVVYSDSLGAVVHEIDGSVSTSRLAVRVSGDAGPDELEPLLGEHAPREAHPRLGTDQFFMHTGGTTGKPRGVIWRQQDIIHSRTVPVNRPVGLDLPQHLDEAVSAPWVEGEGNRLRVTTPVVPPAGGTRPSSCSQTCHAPRPARSRVRERRNA